MKILYGVQGTGNGHISRARKMAAHFRARGADVTYLLTGRPREKLFDMQVFGDFEYRRGLSMVQVNGKVDYWRTTVSTPATEFIRDVRTLDVDAYDLVITDFEPVTAWAAKAAGKTCMGIGHQYAFGHSIPRHGGNPLGEAVLRWFAPATIRIALHWHHFDTAALPPIIDPQLTHREPREPFVLVYLPFEDQAAVTQMLQGFSDMRFAQYSPDLVDGEAGNVALRQTCFDGFRNDLQHARAVISNAGFELVAECLHMGTPVLVKAVQGQMEQISNAFALERLKWGSAIATLDKTAIRRWLDQSRHAPSIQYPDVAGSIVDWILEGEWADQSELWETLWACTHTRAAVA
ncbi:MAG: MJ1255/VC2487 family glycosyltransferase [Spongiibacteraceae bacterium]